MPTFNQLVRKGRQTSVKKSTAPALQKGYNSLKKKATDTSAPYLERACLLLATHAVSSVPLTMWYLVPGKSFTLPPRIRTTLCS